MTRAEIPSLSNKTRNIYPISFLISRSTLYPSFRISAFITDPQTMEVSTEIESMMRCHRLENLWRNCGVHKVGTLQFWFVGVFYNELYKEISNRFLWLFPSIFFMICNAESINIGISSYYKLLSFSYGLGNSRSKAPLSSEVRRCDGGKRRIWYSLLLNNWHFRSSQKD